MKAGFKVLLVVGFAALAGCGTVPQNRQQYIKSGGVTKDTVTIHRSLNAVLASVSVGVRKCVGIDTQTSGTFTSRDTTTSYIQIKRVSSRKAELTLRQTDSNGIGQPKGGYYFMAADLNARGRSAAKITFYHYDSSGQNTLVAAIKHWANGEDHACYGVEGKS